MQNVLSLKLIIILSLFPHTEQVFFLIRSFKYSQINIFSSLFKGGRTGEPTPFVRLPSYLFTALLVVFFYYQFLLLTFDLFIFFKDANEYWYCSSFLLQFLQINRSPPTSEPHNKHRFLFLLNFSLKLFILPLPFHLLVRRQPSSTFIPKVRSFTKSALKIALKTTIFTIIFKK